jgi:uncharacterized surface protein with fasciclin (FAS1) repeats
MEAPKDIVSAAAAQPQFSTFSALVVEAGLTEALVAVGPNTVLIPTNDAFKAVPAKKLEELKADKAKLKAVLTFHVLPGKLAAADLKPGKYKSLNGADVLVQTAGALITINEEAIVTSPDVAASNGVIHGIDRVLTPPAPKK